MWPWLLIPISVSSLILTPAFADPVEPAGVSLMSNGPVSSEEGAILWKDGKDDFLAGRYDLAVNRLERFIGRYAGYPGYLEAKLILGRAHLKLNEPEKGKMFLKDYVDAQKNVLEASRAGLDLTRAYLMLRAGNEALLTAEQIIKAKLPGHPEILAEALTLKAESLMTLNRATPADQALSSAQKILPATAPLALKGEVLETQLELKLRECGKFPDPGPLDEAQVRDQLSRRGSCLLEALLVFRNQLAVGDGASADLASFRVMRAYQAYAVTCSSPPPPPPTLPLPRSPEQLKAYYQEIVGLLQQDCREKTRQGHELLLGWTPATPPLSSEPLIKASKELAKLSQPPGAPHP